MAEKKKLPKFITPKGVAVFPWLNKPDTKFKPEGEYKIGVRMSSETAQPLIEKLQGMHDEVAAKAKKNPKNKGKKIKENLFFKPVLDDDGEETGDVEFTFKMKASGVKKDGEKWTMKPRLFDANNDVLSPEARVFGGSLVKVSFQVTEYDKPIGCGLSLRLEAVKVIKLVEGNADASSYGFGDDSDDEDADTPAEGGDGPDTDDDEEGGEGDDF